MSKDTQATVVAGDRSFKFGQSVVHAGKPEWGPGVITRVESIRHDARPAQRLHVRFPNGIGMKVLNTAFAEVRSADEAPPNGVAESNGAGAGWLADLEKKDPTETIIELAEPALDPFRTLWQRLEFTLKLYRFKRDAKSMTEWAIAQTGLIDPLSQFTRHELEQFFDRWARTRDQHLARLVDEAKKQDPQRVRDLLKAADADARQALNRVNNRR
ncbi:MAG: DUF3553 domain-containing protein [Phycisphaerales bacterium]